MSVTKPDVGEESRYCFLMTVCQVMRVMWPYVWATFKNTHIE